MEQAGGVECRCFACNRTGENWPQEQGDACAPDQGWASGWLPRGAALWLEKARPPGTGLSV